MTHKHFWLTAVLALGILGGIFVSSANAQSPTFNTNLSFGLRGNTDVTVLQEFLTTEGFYSGPVTGNFFSLTRDAVKRFQAANGIVPANGYFGPLTRAKASTLLAAEVQVYQNQFSTSVIGPAVNVTTTPPTTAQGGLTMTTLLQARIGTLFQKVWSLQRKYKQSAPTPTPTSPSPVYSGGGSNNGGGSITPAPIPPQPASAISTLTVNIIVNGGTAKASNFTITVRDTTAGTTMTNSPFIFTRGDAYAVAEATTTGSANYTIAQGSACSGTMDTATITCTITNTLVAPIIPAVTINPATLPSAVAGTSYGPFVLTASTTARGPFTWSVTGSLPAGLAFTGNTATIFGIPTEAKASTFSIKTTNGTSSSTRSYTINVTATPIVTSVPAVGTLQWGAFNGGTTGDVTSFDALVNKPANLVSVFVGWGSGNLFPSEYGSAVRDQGKTLLLFWEQHGTTLDSIIAGDSDSYIQSFATAARTYSGPVILAPLHEMNGDWDSWDGPVGINTPAKVVAAWKHIHDVFGSVPNVKFAWVVNNISEPNTAANAIGAYYPGDTYTDYVGVDGFNFGNPWQTWDQVFPSSLMTTLASYGKPIYITSMGTVPGSQKAQWIADLGSHIKNYPQVVGWVWFNQNGSDGDFLINSDAGSLAAFQAVVPQ